MSAAVVGLSAALAGAGEVATPSAQPEVTKEQLLERLNAMQAKLDRLEEKQTNQEHVIDKAAADAAVEAVQRDAREHSQLLDMEGFTAGYNNGGFVIRSANGDFLMHPWVQLAFRNITNYREEGKSNGSDNLQNGFEYRRAKIGFDGNLWGPDFKYTCIWATDRKSEAFGLEEVWFMYKFGDLGVFPEPLSIQAGQFKNYFAHESMNSSKKILAVERSLLNDVFTGGDNFIQGVGIIYNEGSKGGPLQAGVVINDGSNDFSGGVSSQPRNFQDFPTNKWDFGAAARVQYKLFGNWKDYDDFTTTSGHGDPLLVAGAALDYSEAGDFDQILHTADLQYKSGPLSLYGAFLGRSLRHAGVGGAGSVNSSPATAGTGNFYDWGVTAKAAYALDKKWELFGQYSYINFDDGEFAAGLPTDVHEITVGLNYYMHGQNAKFTIDGVWLPNGTPVSSDGGGILAEPNGKNELLLRAQFQLLI